jgi:uncharacterized protein (DUF1778 family)
MTKSPPSQKAREPADQTAKTTRFEARLTPYARKIIQRAAEIQGRSMSDFVVAAAEQAAEKALKDIQIIELSLEDQRRFAEAMLNPPEPGPAWKTAIETHRRLIRESR